MNTAQLGQRIECLERIAMSVEGRDRPMVALVFNYSDGTSEGHDGDDTESAQYLVNLTFAPGN